MTGRPFAEVASVGSAAPERVLTNHELSQVLDTSDQWIVERTGIRERRIAAPDQTVAMLSRDASLLALDRAGVGVEELDTIVLATASPDRLLPSTACDLQALLGATNAAAFDVVAACPGYVYALTVAEGLIASGQSKTVLVVGAEKLSTITDFQDRSTAILFGDADRLLIALIQSLMLLALYLAGREARLGGWYDAGLVAAACYMLYQQALIRGREPDLCFRAFLSNNGLGAMIFAGILLDYTFTAL